MIKIKQRMQSLSLKVKRQFDTNIYSKLWYAVFHQTLRDAFLPNTDGCTDADKRRARVILLTDMKCLWFGGVDPEWFRRVLKESELLDIVAEKLRVKMKKYARYFLLVKMDAATVEYKQVKLMVDYLQLS